jgi:hypothetical protein
MATLIIFFGLVSGLIPKSKRAEGKEVNWKNKGNWFGGT